MRIPSLTNPIPFASLNRFRKIRRRTQAVREWSAKPLCIGSIPIGALFQVFDYIVITFLEAFEGVFIPLFLFRETK